MANELEGKVAVVTGGTDGIGKACAIAMLDAGATVVVVGRDPQKFSSFSKYPLAIPMSADLLNAEDRHNLVTRVLDQTGNIDIFHANAGAYIGGNFVDNDPDAIEKVLTLNVIGAITPIRHVLPHMLERKTGDIIVTGSIAGDGYRPYHEVIYGPSKAAPEGFVRLLRPQVARDGVRVASLSPGPTKTPLVNSCDPARLAAAVAAQEFISPEEVADVFMFMVTRPRHIAIPNMTVTPKNFTML